MPTLITTPGTITTPGDYTIAISAKTGFSGSAYGLGGDGDVAGGAGANYVAFTVSALILANFENGSEQGGDGLVHIRIPDRTIPADTVTRVFETGSGIGLSIEKAASAAADSPGASNATVSDDHLIVTTQHVGGSGSSDPDASGHGGGGESGGPTSNGANASLQVGGAGTSGGGAGGNYGVNGSDPGGGGGGNGKLGGRASLTFTWTDVVAATVTDSVNSLPPSWPELNS
jgi:hypothetical protein